MMWMCVCLILSIIILCFVLVDKSKKEKAMLLRLNDLINDAIDGKQIQEIYDEKLLSKIEGRFLDFLKQSYVARSNITSEQQRIKELISDISHQTKTPITNLRLYTELLMEEDLPDSAMPCTKQILAQVDRITFLIDTLIKLSRLESGIIRLNPKNQSIGNLLEILGKQFTQQAENKNIVFEVEKNNVGAIYDLKWTAEAVGNIVDNAIKYTDKGYVKISVVPFEMFIRVDICDTGTGISKSEHEKIFHRFYRSHNVAEDEGLGIGLYLSRSIMSSQGGYIKVSDNEKGGSVFSVFIPKY